MHEARIFRVPTAIKFHDLTNMTENNDLNVMGELSSHCLTKDNCIKLTRRWATCGPAYIWSLAYWWGPGRQSQLDRHADFALDCEHVCSGGWGLWMIYTRSHRSCNWKKNPELWLFQVQAKPSAILSIKIQIETALQNWVWVIPVWILPRVYPHVVCELRLLLDPLPANFTCKLCFLMGCHVTLHSPRIILISANLAIDLRVGSVFL